MRELTVLVRRAVGLLAEHGLRAFLREAWGRSIGRVLFGLPWSTSAAALRLNLDYRRWLESHRITEAARDALHARSDRLTSRPLISVLMPVYNTPPELLEGAVRSVVDQVYDSWELCIVNDASTHSHVRPSLDRLAAGDRRVKVRHLETNLGIAGASQCALDLAAGEFIALLDHDDELTVDALLVVAEQLADDPMLDVIYSDEDKRASGGALIEPFFKPAWSPFLLRSMNYITHLSVFRTAHARHVGGFRPGFDGSQDYDLLLRATETTKRIAHIPQVLYHYRQLAESAALNPNAKPYAYDAAVRALDDSLRRRELSGYVEKRQPGYYRTRYPMPDPATVAVVRVGQAGDRSDRDSAPTLTEALARSTPAVSFVAVCSSRVVLAGETFEPELVAYAALPDVGAAGPLVVDADGNVVCAGITYAGGRFRGAFAGWPQRGWGPYFGILRSTHDCLGLAACLVVRTELLNVVNAADIDLHSPYAEIELCSRLRRLGLSIVCVPEVVVTMPDGLAWSGAPLPYDTRPVQDPFLNPNLDLSRGSVRMAVESGVSG